MTQNNNYAFKDTDTMLVLNKLRKGLNEFLKPEVLDKFVTLSEELGGDNPSCMLERHDWFVNNGKYGESCPYAKMAKTLFLEDNSDNVIELLKWLNENWVSKLEE
jgi:hypothetical protein